MDAFRFSRIGISEELICNDLHIVVLGFVLKIFSINFIKEIIILMILISILNIFLDLII